MKAFYILILLLFMVFSTSCGIFEPDNEIPIGYPVSYPEISQSDIDSLKVSFAILNGEDVCIKFNQFGRSQHPGCGHYRPLENITDSLRMTSLAKSFLLKNSVFTGIFDTTDIDLVSRGANSYNDSVYSTWGVFVRKQVIEGITVLYSNIDVYLNSNGVLGTGGAWYENLLIPSRDNYSAAKAKEMIIGHKVTYFSWSGEGQFNITRDQIQDEVEKFILPVYKEGELQLRVVWQIKVDHPGWYVYFDTITGEIVQIRQLWVS